MTILERMLASAGKYGALWSPEGEGGGDADKGEADKGDADKGDADKGDEDSTLLTDRNKKDDATKGDADKGDEGDKELEVVEYKPDEKKTAEENAKLKEDHDKKEKERVDGVKKARDEEARKPKPYVDDPKKSKEENEKAKGEHDRREKARTEYHGSPEAYEPFKLPDGLAADESKGERFKTLAKELDLSQAASQKVVDLAAEIEKEGLTKWQETVKGWATASKADKEFGGQKFDASVGKAAEVLNAFGTKEFDKFLADYGGGNHPEMIRFCVRIGEAMGEGLAERAKEKPGGQNGPTTEAVFYDKSKK